MTSVDLNILAQGIRTVGDEDRVEFVRWSADNPLLIGGILSALGLYAVIWLYRREARGQVTTALRWSMICCRALVLMLLGLIGLEPVIVHYQQRRQDACTLVLVDESASMSLADHYRRREDAGRFESALGPVPPSGAVRADVCEKLLDGPSTKLLTDLTQKNEVKSFAFAERSRLLNWSTRSETGGKVKTVMPSTATEPSDEIHIKPQGSATDLGTAVRGALEATSSTPISGIILLTDGGFNHGESTAVVSRLLNQRGIPVYPIGIGDPVEPINIRVAEISAPRSVFKNDPFSVSVKIEQEGSPDPSLTVELLERRSEGAEPQVVDSRQIVRAADGRFPPAVFDRKIAQPGTVSYLARVAPQPYEAVVTDNEREILPPVHILDNKMKVLIVAGAPSYDYRFLARMLERDQTVELSTWLQSADIGAVRDGTKVIKELPTAPEDVFKYDVIVLLDCDPKEFDPTWGDTLAMFVTDRGGGLLYAAGNKYTGQFFRAPNMKSVAEILPIVPDPDAEILLNELGHYQTRAWPLVIPDQSADDPVLRLSDNAAESRAIWSSIGSVYWHYPVRREKPVAKALMRDGNPKMANAFGQHVLLASQLVGTGRTAYLGINSTWRWRRWDERYFDRFWIQTLRYLFEGRLLGGQSRGEIMITKDHFELGEAIVLNVRALTQRFEPLLLPSMDVKVTTAARTVENEPLDKNAPESISLTPITGRDGYYQGRFVADQVGMFRLQVMLPVDAAEGAADEKSRVLEKEIVVAQPDLEMKHTVMNRAGLQQLAEQVGNGSQYLDIDRASAVPELIQDRSRTFTVRGRPKPLWDNAYVFGFLVLVLSVEWILRKKAKLL